MVTTSKSGYRPHSIEYRRIQQVDVPDTYTLRELVAGMEDDIGAVSYTHLRAHET